MCCAGMFRLLWFLWMYAILKYFLEWIMSVISWIRFYFLLETRNPRRTWKQWKPLGQPRGVPSYVLNFQIRLLGLGLWGSRRDVRPRLSQKIQISWFSYPKIQILNFEHISVFISHKALTVRSNIRKYWRPSFDSLDFSIHYPPPVHQVDSF